MLTIFFSQVSRLTMLGCIGRKCSGDGSGVSSNINWILNSKPIGVFWRAIIWKRSVSTAGCAVIVALSSWPFLVANFITNCAVSRDNDSDFSTGDYRPKGLWCTILFYWCCYRSPDHSTWLTGRGLTGWARSAPRVLRHHHHHHRTSMAPFTKYSSANGALQYEST